MGQDICVPVGEGVVNVRVGAIIEKNGKYLMVRSDEMDYCYSVGGRIQMGESAGDAVRREVLEETGCELEIERLGFVHEDFFYGDRGGAKGKLIYEIGFYYYMKTPADFAPRADGIAEEGQGEYLKWVRPEEEKTVFPAFFHTALADPKPYVRHFVTDERTNINEE